jgi:hypothetical protein
VFAYALSLLIQNIKGGHNAHLCTSGQIKKCSPLTMVGPATKPIASPQLDPLLSSPSLELSTHCWAICLWCCRWTQSWAHRSVRYRWVRGLSSAQQSPPTKQLPPCEIYYRIVLIVRSVGLEKQHRWPERSTARPGTLACEATELTTVASSFLARCCGRE